MTASKRDVPATPAFPARPGTARAPARRVHRLAADRRGPRRARASCCAPPGVAVVGGLVQHRERPHPNTYLGPGKLVELKRLAAELDANVIACDDELSPRQERTLEQRARAAGRRPHGGDPRHLRPPRRQRRGQAPGRARPARIQPRADARACGRTSSGSAAASARAGPGETQIETDRRLARDRIAALRRRLRGVHASREVMRGERERSQLPADRARRVHERRQVDAAGGAHRRGGRRRRPPVPHARPDHSDARDQRAHLPGHRHGRLHPQASPPARRRLRGDARGDPPRAR